MVGFGLETTAGRNRIIRSYFLSPNLDQAYFILALILHSSPDVCVCALIFGLFMCVNVPDANRFACGARGDYFLASPRMNNRSKTYFLVTF
jgi:hypothetical protein